MRAYHYQVVILLEKSVGEESVLRIKSECSLELKDWLRLRKCCWSKEQTKQAKKRAEAGSQVEPPNRSPD